MRLRYLVFLGIACGPLAKAGEPEVRKLSITIEASPTILMKGMECRVKLQPDEKSKSNTEHVTYEGKIVETSAEGIMLMVISEERKVDHTASYATRVPFGNRLFRNVGIGRSKPKEEKKVWIPNEKIQLLQSMKSEVFPIAAQN